MLADCEETTRQAIRKYDKLARYTVVESDGSLADYLAVIKGDKKNNIPAVLIEHCFISNKEEFDKYMNMTDEDEKNDIMTPINGIEAFAWEY